MIIKNIYYYIIIKYINYNIIIEYKLYEELKLLNFCTIVLLCDTLSMQLECIVNCQYISQ